MDYKQYIAYHNKGDAGVEERMIASLAKHYKMSRWDSFRLVYYYTTTYHIPSALKLYFNPNTPKNQLKFRTDRRYVRIGDTYEKVMNQLQPSLLTQLDAAETTTQQYNIVSGWYFFGRYATFLFLEVWSKLNEKQILDDLNMNWEENENYTKGAILIVGSSNKEQLNLFIDDARKDTNDNVFSLETSLCAVCKIKKGTRWEGYYTERLLEDISGCEYESLILSLL